MCRVHAETQVAEGHMSQTLLLPERERKRCTDSSPGPGWATSYHKGWVQIYSRDSGQLLSIRDGDSYQRKNARGSNGGVCE